MNTTLATLKTQIALGYLTKKLIIWNFIKAWRWAFGWMSPAYTDNREALSFPEIRMTVVRAFLEIIKEQGFKWDAIWATMTAGVPWAAILAYELNMDLYLYDEKANKLYRFTDLRSSVQQTFDLFQTNNLDGYDALIANTPLGIVYGAVAAHVAGKPFLYVRDQKKPHGKMNWIEGRFEDGIRAAYLHIATEVQEMEKFNTNIALLKNEAITLRAARFEVKPELVVSQDVLKGLILGIIEDLVSTAFSSIGKEAANCRKMGAIVKDMVAVFHYKFQMAEDAAKAAGITIHYILDFPYLLKAGHAGGKISTDDKQKLTAWYADPEKYSANYLIDHPDEVQTKA